MNDSDIRQLMENIYNRKGGADGQDVFIREICERADIFPEQENVYKNELLVMVVPGKFADYNEVKISTRRVICDDGARMVSIPYEDIVNFGGKGESGSDFFSKITIRSKCGDEIVIKVNNVECRRALLSVLLNRVRAAKPKVT